MAMKTSDMVKALRGVAKKNPYLNHQEKELLLSAAIRLAEQGMKLIGMEEKLNTAAQIGLEIQMGNLSVAAATSPLSGETGGGKDDFWDPDNCE